MTRAIGTDLDRRTIKLSKDSIPIPPDQHCPVRLVFPSITDVGQYGSQRNDLRLIGQVKNAIDVQHVQKLRRLHEAPLHLRFISLVFVKREVQQCLPVACNGRQFLTLFSGLLSRAPPITRMKKRNCLKKIGIRDTGDDSGFYASRPERF